LGTLQDNKSFAVLYQLFDRHSEVAAATEESLCVRVPGNERFFSRKTGSE
jgi:hypothetical protein